MAEPSPSSGRDEIVSLRTATAKFFREADGSRTAQVYAGPIHFRARDGSWTEIDSTLVPSPLPRFAWQNRRGPVTFAFAAAAGEAELVRVREGSLTIGFGLAGASPLSVGVVDDNRITYPDVFPGIDLRFEVQGENLKQALILRRAPSSSLAFQFPLFLEGLVPRPEASGEVALVARDGTVAFRIPRGWMLDSSDPRETGRPNRSEEVGVRLVTSATAPVATITPDLDWLRDPRREYPIVVDPSLAQPTNLDSYIWDQNPDAAYYGGTSLYAGRAYYRGLEYGETMRTLLAFEVSSLNEKHIYGANLLAYATECGGPATIYRVTSGWWAGTTWNTQPAIGEALASQQPGCPTWNSFPVTAAVRNWTSGAWANHGLEIRGDESNPEATTRVSLYSAEAGAAPYLSISYNEPPTIAPDSPANGASVPLVTPVLAALGSDLDGDRLDYLFQVADDAGFSSIRCSSGWLPSTNTFTVPLACNLTDGATYYWRARARDQYREGPWSGGRSFTVGVKRLGVRDYWPMWSHGPLAVNLQSGNLILSLPGPSYPTAVGSMGASVTYNTFQPQDRGLGPRWTLVAGDELASPPARLVDHSLLSGEEEFDAAEVVFPDGGSDYYTHVGGSNTYVAAPGDGSQLTKNADGTWTLVDSDGAIYTFGQASGTSGVATLASAEIVDAERGKGRLAYAFSAQDPTKITSITDAAGRRLVFAWNGLDASACPNAILCITGPDSVTWRYAGDGSGGTSGRLARIHNGTRDLFALAYDGAGRVVKVQNANDLNPGAASPGYNGDHALTIGYDGAGRVANVSEGPVTGQSPATSTWIFAYSPGQVATSATRASHEGVLAGTVRTARGYTTVTPPREQGQQNPRTVKTYYDDLGHPMETVDLLGNVMAVSYNKRDQLLWSEDEEGSPSDYTWDAANDVLLSTTGPDPDGGGPLPRPVTSYRYDEEAIGTAAAPGPALEGLQASYFDNVNLAGRAKARQTDATVDFNWGTGGPAVLPGRTDQFSVRWTGNLVVPATGDYILTTVADDGTRVTVDGVVAIDNWRDQGAVPASSPPIRLTAGTHKLVLEYYENGGGAQVQLRFACGGCTPNVPDQVVPPTALRPAWLNQTSEVSPGGRVSFHHFADPAAARADYDLAKLGDGTNVITSYAYDSFGRITQKVMPKGNASRTIDAQGNLQGTPDLTYATTWSYYGPGETAAPPPACGGGSAVAQAELLKAVTPNGIAPTTTVYDAAGRAIATTKGVGTTCRSYDAEGRLTSERAPGESQATTYAYDPAGGQRRAEDASGTVAIDYDEAGRIVKSKDSFGAEATFAYDAEGNVLRRTAAAGPLATSPNFTSTFDYDGEGRVTSVADPAGRSYRFSYDRRGSLRAVQYPNGTFAWHDYNQTGWLTALYNRHGELPSPLPGSVPADSEGSPLADFTYRYDVEGRKVEEARTGGGLATETTGYRYDAVGRLDQVTLPGGTIRDYRFDLDSNRVGIDETPSGGPKTTVATYTYDPSNPASPGLDQLTNLSENGQTRTFEYRPDGEMTRRGSDTLTWDGRGRMSGGTFQGSPLATSVSYGFDPLGRRRERTGGGVTTRYLFAGIGEAPLFETNALGVIVNTEVEGAAGDVAHYAGPPFAATPASFLYYNGHGDVATAADALGTRTNAYTYDPFGAPRQMQPANATVERWTGRWDKQLDTAASLIQMGVRPYDPALGRFLAVDPVDGASFNSYDYAFQDPINVYDLDGRCPVCAAVGRLVVGRGVKWAIRQLNKRAANMTERGARRSERLLRPVVRRSAANRGWIGRVELHAPGKGHKYWHLQIWTYRVGQSGSHIGRVVRIFFPRFYNGPH